MKDRLTKLFDMMQTEYDALGAFMPERVALLCSMADLGCELARIEAAREMHYVLEQDFDDGAAVVDGGVWLWDPHRETN